MSKDKSMDENNAISISSEAAYSRVMSLIGQKKKSRSFMTLLINKMEQYRQSKKYGWSRSWNKENLVTFQSYKLKIAEDEELLSMAKEVLNVQFAEMPADAKTFYQDMISDRKKLMGYVFVQDSIYKGEQFESITISLGRINNKQFRDRLDIILDCPIDKDASSDLIRIRVYIDPYRANDSAPLYTAASEDVHASSQNLFALATAFTWVWKDDQSRIWSHWVQNYIDYFGKRMWDLKKSYFYSGESTQRNICNSDYFIV